MRERIPFSSSSTISMHKATPPLQSNILQRGADMGDIPILPDSALFSLYSFLPVAVVKRFLYSDGN
jgi:hypothetical protein